MVSRRGLRQTIALAMVATLVVLAAVTTAKPESVSAGTTAGWTAQVSGTTNDLYDVCFVDRYCGWAVGSGVILATTDGGKTWMPQAADPDVAYLSVSCTDYTHCWVSVSRLDGSWQGVIATTDGGRTWNLQLDYYFAVHSNLCFIDNLHGWGTELGQIHATSDGGVTWTAFGLPRVETPDGEYTPFVQGLSFADAAHGWAVGIPWLYLYGGEPFVFATRDGGITWEIQKLPEGINCLYGVDFVDAEYGWAVGSDSDEYAAVVHTTDGGATWVRQDVPRVVLFFEDVSFVDRQRGWAVGDRIAYTTDGGQTWEVERDVPELRESTRTGSKCLYAVHFVDAEHGWAVGSGGTILCYSPEGGTGPVFTDLEGYDWARDSIEFLASQGILKGVGEGRFEPGGIVTREQFAALVERVFNLPQPPQPVSYSDMPASHWAYRSVQAASPYMPPLDTSTFGMGEPCTRETAASVLVRVLLSRGLQYSSSAEPEWWLQLITDAESITPSLRPLIGTSIMLDIIKGKPDGRFDPQGVLDRAQAAVLLDRVRTRFRYYLSVKQPEPFVVPAEYLGKGVASAPPSVFDNELVLTTWWNVPVDTLILSPFDGTATRGSSTYHRTGETLMVVEVFQADEQGIYTLSFAAEAHSLEMLVSVGEEVKAGQAVARVTSSKLIETFKALGDFDLLLEFRSKDLGDERKQQFNEWYELLVGTAYQE